MQCVYRKNDVRCEEEKLVRFDRDSITFNGWDVSDTYLWEIIEKAYCEGQAEVGGNPAPDGFIEVEYDDMVARYDN
jgi:hypothetical protein